MGVGALQGQRDGQGQGVFQPAVEDLDRDAVQDLALGLEGVQPARGQGCDVQGGAGLGVFGARGETDALGGAVHGHRPVAPPVLQARQGRAVGGAIDERHAHQLRGGTPEVDAVGGAVHRGRGVERDGLRGQVSGRGREGHIARRHHDAVELHQRRLAAELQIEEIEDVGQRPAATGGGAQGEIAGGETRAPIHVREDPRGDPEDDALTRQGDVAGVAVARPVGVLRPGGEGDGARRRGQHFDRQRRPVAAGIGEGQQVPGLVPAAGVQQGQGHPPGGVRGHRHLHPTAASAAVGLRQRDIALVGGPVLNGFGQGDRDTGADGLGIQGQAAAIEPHIAFDGDAVVAGASLDREPAHALAAGKGQGDAVIARTGVDADPAEAIRQRIGRKVHPHLVVEIRARDADLPHLSQGPLGNHRRPTLGVVDDAHQHARRVRGQGQGEVDGPIRGRGIGQWVRREQQARLERLQAQTAGRHRAGRGLPGLPRAAAAGRRGMAELQGTAGQIEPAAIAPRGERMGHGKRLGMGSPTPPRGPTRVSRIGDSRATVRRQGCTPGHWPLEAREIP